MYNAKDIRPTRAFYQKLFGFKRGHEWTEFWSEFDTEPLTFCLNGLSKTVRPEWNWQGAACMALAVDDVPDAVAKCRKLRVKILIEPVETRVCWMAWTPIRRATGSASIHAKTAPLDSDAVVTNLNGKDYSRPRFWFPEILIKPAQFQAPS
jgi:hypothetical protein